MTGDKYSNHHSGKNSSAVITLAWKGEKIWIVGQHDRNDLCVYEGNDDLLPVGGPHGEDLGPHQDPGCVPLTAASTSKKCFQKPPLHLKNAFKNLLYK